MFVKVCGLTQREDALAAVEAGAAALGFVFVPSSPRRVRAEALAPWIGEIPRGVLRVGVFMDEQRQIVERIAAQLQLDVAQLHGSETPADHPRGVNIWKAFRITNGTLCQPEYPADALLLDGPGSGRTFDWGVAAQARRPFVLAGGLTPGNVKEAVERTRPWGVDTSSGVEISPGRKDHAKMRTFIEAALHT